MRIDLKKVCSKKNLIMTAIGIALNYLLFLLGSTLNLPVWLDTTGTILVAVTCGLIPATAVAVVNNLLLVLHFGFESLAFVFVSFSLVVVFWFFGRKNKLSNVLNISGAMLTGIIVKAFTCTLIYLILAKTEPSNAYETIIFMALKNEMKFTPFWCFLFSNIFISFLDGLGTVVFVVLGYRFIYFNILKLLRNDEMKYLEADARTESIYKVQEFVEKELEDCAVLPKVSAQINIAVEEIIANIVNHGYSGQGGFFKFGCRKKNGVLYMEFIDKAPAFDPLKVSADTVSGLEDRKMGGLGIYMVKKSMDAVSYRYENGLNILAMQKKITLPKENAK